MISRVFFDSTKLGEKFENDPIAIFQHGNIAMLKN
jgi:hypothetical protein